MGQSGRCLEQQQTVLRRSREESASARFLDQMLVIFRRLEAEQREAKPILTARFAVTAAGVATGLGENGHDLIRKIDGRDLVEMFDDDGKGSAQTLRSLRGDGRRAVAQRRDATALVNGDDVGGRRGIAYLSRE